MAVHAEAASHAGLTDSIWKASSLGETRGGGGTPAGLMHQVEFMPVESVGHGKGGILGGDLLVVPLTSDGVVEHAHQRDLKVGFDLTPMSRCVMPRSISMGRMRIRPSREQTIHVRGRS